MRRRGHCLHDVSGHRKLWEVNATDEGGTQFIFMVVFKHNKCSSTRRDNLKRRSVACLTVGSNSFLVL